MLFWFEVYEENPDSEDMPLKKGGRSILIAFANNCSYSLLLHQNLASGHFLKVSCNMKSMSKTTSINLLYYITLVSLALGMYIFYWYDFVTSCIDHLKNIGWLSYADVPNVSTFHYPKSKHSHLVLSPIWPEQSLNTEKPSSFKWQETTFANYNFRFKGWIFSLTTNTVNGFP